MKPYSLKVIDGPETGREFDLIDQQQLVVGRGTASDTKINDPRVSRVHCQVSLEGGKVTLKASETAGDTLVHGRKIAEQELRSGDCFRIGDTTIRLDGGHEILDQSTMHGGNVMQNLVGESFANFRMDSVISTGRTGVVYKATDTEKNRTAAVKVLLPSVSSSEDQRERFVRAMRTMLPIRHPNIIRLYNAGKKSRFCWVAMEYVEGESMEDVIARIGVQNMLDWRKAWEVAVDIGRALQCASDNNIVHRNLSPANIIRRESDGVSLLGDLMFAKATEGSQSFDVTMPGQLLGDVSYMSPERTQSNASIDSRSDIYELGATLYALLTGRPPFEADSQVEQIKKIREEDPVSPKTYQISINDMFENVVLTMLAKTPEDRYASADKLLGALERVGKFVGLSRD